MQQRSEEAAVLERSVAGDSVVLLVVEFVFWVDDVEVWPCRRTCERNSDGETQSAFVNRNIVRQRAFKRRCSTLRLVVPELAYSPEAGFTDLDPNPDLIWVIPPMHRQREQAANEIPLRINS